MSEKFCTYAGDREGILVAYLYDEIAPVERKAFELHISTCETCSTELSGLAMTRARLDEWASPEPAHPLPGRIPLPAADRPTSRWQDLPAWVQSLAALLVFGVTAGAANLHIVYNQDGLAIRTGWLSAASSSPSPSPSPSQKLDSTAASPEPAATRAEVTAIAEALRAEIKAATPSAPSVQQVRALITDSERKQQTELALRIANLYKDTQAQRAADMVKIDRYLSSWSSNTGLAVRRQDESIRSIQVRLAQGK